MSNTKSRDRKLEALEEFGAVNPRARDVRDDLFLGGDFFDPRDLVQVKYELLRRVRAEGMSVTEAVSRFGLSRPTFYKAASDFDKEGLPGLLPRKRGPKGPHKLTPEIVSYLEETVAGGEVDPIVLSERVRRQYGREIHPRTIQRTLARRKKKPH